MADEAVVARMGHAMTVKTATFAGYSGSPVDGEVAARACDSVRVIVLAVARLALADAKLFAVVVVDPVATGALHYFGMKLLVVAIAARALDSIEIVRASSRVALEAVARRGLRGVALKTPAKVRGRGLRRGAVDRIYMAARARSAARVLGLCRMALQTHPESRDKGLRLMLVVRAVAGIAIDGPRMERERVAVPAIVLCDVEFAVVVVLKMALSARDCFGMEILVVAIAARALDSIEIVRALSRVASEAVAARLLAGMALKAPVKFGAGRLRRGAVDRLGVTTCARGTARVLGLCRMAIETDIESRDGRHRFMLVVRTMAGIAIDGPRMERERVAVPAIIFSHHQLAVMVV